MKIHFKGDFKQKLKNYSKKIFGSTALLLLTTTAVPAFAATPQELQNQINQLNSKINQIDTSLNANQSQQQSIEGIINSINNQIQSIELQVEATQKQIEVTNNQITETNSKIEKSKKDLTEQRRIMGGYLKVMYEDDQTSTVELIATSNSFSDFVDQAQYLDTMHKKVKETGDRIIAIENELKERAKELDGERAKEEQLKASQIAQQAAVQNQKNYQQSLLADAQRKATALNNQKDGIAAQKAQLSAAYNESIVRASSYAPSATFQRNGTISVKGGSGNYPYGNPPAGNMIDRPDAFGYLIGECTSYAAWKRASVGRTVPRAMGNGGQWAGTAIRLGLPVDRSPRAGDVMVFPNLGGYGHVAYVEAVYGNGTVLISEYNWIPYSYDQRVVNPYNYGALFIH